MVEGIGQRPFVGDTPFDAFRHQLRGVIDFALKIAILTALGHGAEAAHAAVHLVAFTLVDHHFAGRFIGPSEHATDHHGVGTTGQSLDDIAAELDATVGDDRHAGAARRCGTLHDGRELRHANPGDDPSGADRSRSDTDLDAVGSRLDQGGGAFSRRHVAADDFKAEPRKGLFHRGDRIEHALTVAMGGVDADDVGSGLK